MIILANYLNMTHTHGFSIREGYFLPLLDNLAHDYFYNYAQYIVFLSIVIFLAIILIYFAIEFSIRKAIKLLKIF